LLGYSVAADLDPLRRSKCSAAVALADAPRRPHVVTVGAAAVGVDPRRPPAAIRWLLGDPAGAAMDDDRTRTPIPGEPADSIHWSDTDERKS